MATAPSPGEQLKETFAQRNRAGIPFNPVANSVVIQGANIERLKQAMEANGWTDLRFVTPEQAQNSGWSIKRGAKPVELQIRNPKDGTMEALVVHNAKDLTGIPSLQDMLLLSEDQILGLGLPPVAEAAQEVPVPQLAEPQPVSPAPAAAVAAAEGGTEVANAEMGASAAQLALDDEDVLIAPALTPILEVSSTPAGVLDQPEPSAPEASLQPGFSWLIDHGEANYLDDPDNNKSYFVELEDVTGERRKIWGLDLPRSLEAANAKIGDAIAVEEVGGKDVMVDAKGPDGTIVKKPGRRMEWKTTVQPEVDQDKAAAATGVQVPVMPSPAPARSMSPASSQQEQPGNVRYAVMAPYWLHGLHNFNGLKMAEEINQTIKNGQLSGDKDTIARLFAVYPKARTYGLEVVLESRYLDDPWRKSNPSEPRTLVEGTLVRDKEGNYRPSAGGRSVLQDQGDALLLKSRGEQGYRGAMELAVAKGWKAIELKGRPKLIAEAWLEAKLLGVDVVNYSPTEQDRAKYAERLAELSRAKAEHESQENLEVRPASGHRVTTGSHIGPIVAVNNGSFAQKTGRDPGSIVWHDAANLNGAVPAVGALAEIAYKDGKATIAVRAQEKSQGVSR